MVESLADLEIVPLEDRGSEEAVLEDDEYRRIRTLGDPFSRVAEDLSETSPISTWVTGDDRRK